MPRIRVPMVGQKLSPPIRNMAAPQAKEGYLEYEVSNAQKAFWTDLSLGTQWELIMKADKLNLDLRRVISFCAGPEGN